MKLLSCVIYMTLEHRRSHKHSYICNNIQQYTVWVKIIHYYFMPKIIMILRSWSMKIFSKFSTVNISKLNFWLVICIAKNFIWWRWFSQYLDFLHPQIPDFQSNIEPYINGKMIYSAFRWCSLNWPVWPLLFCFVCSMVTFVNMTYRSGGGASALKYLNRDIFLNY